MIKHGLSKHRNYRSWYMMLKRCNDPFFSQYERCGRFGIKACSEWDNPEDGLTNFIKDMGIRPNGGILHRVNKRIGYTKNNCIWTTARHHNRNKTRNIVLRYNNEKKCLSEWAIEKKISFQTMRYRTTRGYPPEVVLGIVSIKDYNNN